MAGCQNTRSKGNTSPVEAELDSLLPIAKCVKVGKIVGEIKVTDISLIQSQDGPQWYQAVFYASVSLPKSKQVKFKTSKQVWLGRQCDVVTSTLRQKILEKAPEADVDRSLLVSDITMLSDLPFQKAWLSSKIKSSN